MSRPGFSAVQYGGAARPGEKAASLDWAKRIVDTLNAVLKGKQNVVLDITLTPGSATTDIKDARISAFSALILEPLTANAAAALYAAPYVLPSAQADGQVTLNHANNGNTDKNFHLVILG